MSQLQLDQQREDGRRRRRAERMEALQQVERRAQAAKARREAADTNTDEP